MLAADATTTGIARRAGPVAAVQHIAPASQSAIGKTTRSAGART